MVYIPVRAAVRCLEVLNVKTRVKKAIQTITVLEYLRNIKVFTDGVLVQHVRTC